VSVRLSVYLSQQWAWVHNSKTAAVGFAAVGRAGRRYRSIAATAMFGGRMRAVPRFQRT